MDRIVLKNLNMISMVNEKVLKNYDIAIMNGKIVEIGQGLIGSQEIDCTGKYIMPGFTDMHVHTSGENIEDMYLCIANGITSIRVMFGSDKVIELREKAKQKDFLCPSIYTATPIIDGNPPVFDSMIVVDTKQKAREVVLDAKNKGYDFIKVYNNLLMPEFEEIVKTAKEVNMDVVGHRPVDVGTKRAIEYGQYCFEHEKSIQRDYLELAAKKGVYFDPTFIVSEVGNLIQDGEVTENHFTTGLAEFVDANTINKWKESVEFFKDYDFKLERTHEEYLEDMLIFYKAGGKLLTGTDAGMPLVINGFQLHEEFEILSKAGVSNFDVLKATTINAAECNHQEDLYGTVEVDKIANLVILDKNPLENISHTRSIEAVILKGNYLDKLVLNNMLEDIKDRCKRSKT